ncbi:MAG: hypothetical protein IJS50_03075 [Desulfovibrio sp.]|nr:hypothetical protein [Desulfovibrio sp.]
MRWWALALGLGLACLGSSLATAKALASNANFLAKEQSAGASEQSFLAKEESPQAKEQNEQHLTRSFLWKGRKQLPLEQTRELCLWVAEHLGLAKEQAASFLLEIAAAESDFGYYVRQVSGPALSAWQIEPATAKDLCERLPARNFLLYQKIMALKDPNLSLEDNLTINLKFGAAMCLGVLWLKGLRVEELDSLPKRARAWKKYYNTYLGKGTLEGYVQKALRYTKIAMPWAGQFEEKIDLALVRGPKDLFAVRNAERYLLLPKDFEQSEMGRYYLRVLKENPKVFEQVPDGVLKSKNVQKLMGSLTLELVKVVQKDPRRLGEFSDMPLAIYEPVARAAMHENAVLAYPYLLPKLKQDPEMLKILETHRFLLERMGR